MSGIRYRDLEHRLLENSVIDPSTGCWLWCGPRDKRPETPYGRISIYCRETGRQRNFRAHRVAYAELIGPIPEGYQIDHKCRNPVCINPEHLEAVPPIVNSQRRVWKHSARSDAYVG